MRALQLPLCLAFLAVPSAAEIKLPALISDHMVLQRESEVTLWGQADKGEKIRVAPDWISEELSTTAGDDGSFRLRVKTGAAGGPHTLVFKGTNSVRVSDVWFGEVWVCGGQSNMEMPIQYVSKDYSGINEPEKEIAKANRPKIRLFDVDDAFTLTPRAECKGSWTVCSPESAGAFSATAYFFASELQRVLDVPVGLITASMGATQAESWTSADALKQLPAYEAELAKVAKAVANPNDKDAQTGFSPLWAGSLYNGMIAPITSYTIRGAIWYQGESNRGGPVEYRTLFPALIADWRAHWGQGDFPFFFVQIAPHRYRGDQGITALLREAQARALAVPNTGMAVTMDIGDLKDIHPKNKQEVGRRLALLALHKTYGREKVECEGPSFRSIKIAGSEVQVGFEHAKGLKATKEPLVGFALAGADQKFVPATARIEGETVIVSSPNVPEPVALRYGWGDYIEANLANGAGLPCAPFRTDDWIVQGMK